MKNLCLIICAFLIGLPFVVIGFIAKAAYMGFMVGWIGFSKWLENSHSDTYKKAAAKVDSKGTNAFSPIGEKDINKAPTS